LIICISPKKITNFCTHNHIITDYKVKSAEYKNKGQVYTPKFVMITDHRLITNSSLVKILNISHLNDAFHYQDPNLIDHIIQTDLNTIIEVVALVKYIQFT